MVDWRNRHYRVGVDVLLCGSVYVRRRGGEAGSRRWFQDQQGK